MEKNEEGEEGEGEEKEEEGEDPCWDLAAVAHFLTCFLSQGIIGPPHGVIRRIAGEDKAKLASGISYHQSEGSTFAGPHSCLHSISSQGARERPRGQPPSVRSIQKLALLPAQPFKNRSQESIWHSSFLTLQ